MLKSIQTNAQAMNALMTQQDVQANNMSNVNSPGFKREDVRFELAPSPGGGRPSIYPTLLSGHLQGPLQRTENTLDTALEGEGYYVVSTPGGERYTRDGAFTLNAQGQLVTPDGFPVLGKNGPLTFSPEERGAVRIDGDGKVWVGDAEKGSLRLERYNNTATFAREGRSLLQKLSGSPVPGSPTVRQGYLEGSNVDSVREMVSMMNTLRLFESNAKAIRLQDEALSKAVSDLAR